MTISWGWDKSHYDASGGNAKAVSEGFSFITHKIGGDANDAEYATWWADQRKIARDVCLPGAYWILRPDTSGSASSKADAFLARLDAVGDGWRDGPFILQIDCEQWNGDSGTVPSRSYIQAHCDRLVARAPKLIPIVYAPKWTYGNTLAGLSYPLWASAYVGGSGAASALYPGDTSSKWVSYSGQVPEILQFSSSAVIAGQTTCDANAYRGTLAQLTARLAPGWVTNDMADMTNADHEWLKANLPIFRVIPGDPANVRTIGGCLEALVNLALAQQADMVAMRTQLAGMASSLGAAVSALTAKDFVDEQALAGFLADAVAARFPDGTDPLTADEAKAAVLGAFHDAFGTSEAHPVATGLPVFDSLTADDQATAAARRVAQDRVQGER
jgi:hypothetical protein